VFLQKSVQTAENKGARVRKLRQPEKGGCKLLKTLGGDEKKRKHRLHGGSTQIREVAHSRAMGIVVKTKEFREKQKPPPGETTTIKVSDYPILVSRTW
jgi:hypothetical protein